MAGTHGADRGAIGDNLRFSRDRSLAVHARQGISCLDDPGFENGQFLQPLPHGRAVDKVLGQSHVGRMVPGLGFKQAAIKLSQLGIRHVITQLRESLAGQSLN